MYAQFTNEVKQTISSLECIQEGSNNQRITDPQTTQQVKPKLNSP